VEIGELLQYYILNTIINFFLFKNFIALWRHRHLAKTQLLKSICTLWINDSMLCYVML